MNLHAVMKLVVVGTVVAGCSYTPPQTTQDPGGSGGMGAGGSGDGGGGMSSGGGGGGSSSCGNGLKEPGEECDDGNSNNGDGCTSQCKTEETCGDGSLDANEACDDGNTSDNDSCTNACTEASCGDGFVQSGVEACDDGNTDNGDGCNSTCTLENDTSVFIGSPGLNGFVDDVGMNARIGGSPVLAIHKDTLYFAHNAAVRKVDIPTRLVTTIAGAGGAVGYADNGIGVNARFSGTEGIATDGTTIWIADPGNKRIRTVSTSAPYAVGTIIGDGTAGAKDEIGTAATVDDVRGMVPYNGLVYFVDGNTATLRSFDPISLEVKTLAGTAYMKGGVDGVASAARFQSPRYIASNGQGQLYISDTNGSKIRVYDVVSGKVSTVGGNGSCGYVDGSGAVVRVHRPRGITSDGSSVYYVEVNAHTIRQIIPSTPTFSTLSGFVDDCSITCTCPNVDANTPWLGGYLEGVGTQAKWNFPFSIVFDPITKSLFVSDSGNFVIRQIK